MVKNGIHQTLNSKVSHSFPSLLKVLNDCSMNVVFNDQLNSINNIWEFIHFLTFEQKRVSKKCSKIEQVLSFNLLKIFLQCLCGKVVCFPSVFKGP